jgi:integrase
MSLAVVWRNGIAYLHGTVAGRRIRESTRTRDPKLAEVIRAEREARLVRASLYGPEKEATFADAALLYQGAGKRRRYLAPLIRELGKHRLADITPGALESLALKLYPLEYGFANSTRNTNVLKPARAVINYAHRHGLCPHIRVTGFQEVRVERPAGDRAWIDAARSATGDPRMKALLLFLWVTAARKSEPILLRPVDLELDNKIARSRLPTKNGQHRIYYLTDELVAELRALKPRRIHYGRGELRVFGWASEKSIDKPWNKIVEKAGIKRLTPGEAGRHGFATEMIVRRRIDPVTTARLGNWRDVKVLMDRYAHPSDLATHAETVFGVRRPKASGTTLTQRRKKVS